MRAFVCLFVLAACGFPTPEDVPFNDSNGATMGAISGDGQTGAAGEALAEPFVIRISNRGNRVAGITVNFVVTGGNGQLSSTIAATNDDGEVATMLTLGTAVGGNGVQALASGIIGSPVDFSASAIAGAPAFVQATSGDFQAAAIGTALAQPLVVTVEDVHHNVVPGAAVEFVVTTGDAAPATPSVETDSDGRAQTLINLGTNAGPLVIEARVSGASAATLNATALTGSATQLSLVSGNSQNAVAGTAPTAPCVVEVKDAGGNPVPGTNVSFVVTGGGGSAAPTSMVSDSQGRAQTVWTLGTTAGANTIEARVSGLSGSPVVFTATGIAGQATQLVRTSGNNQSATAGSAVTAPLVATVRDANGNPVAGTTVSFAVLAGGGNLSVPSAVSNAQGNAETSLTLGTVAGTNTVQASVTGLTPITFAATGQAGPAVKVALVSGDRQSGALGSTLAPMTVKVTDVNDNAVAGVTVNFSVTAGNGVLSNASFMTGSAGTAQTTLTLGTSGVNRVQATATGLTGSPITFDAVSVGFSKTDLATTDTARAVALGDLNGDGKPDLVVAKIGVGGGDIVSVQFNTTATASSSITFGTRVDFLVGSFPLAIGIGDLDGDGKPDLAVVNDVSGTVSVLRNLGGATPNFASKIDLPTGFGTGIAIGDLNADGKLDLAVSNTGASPSVSVLFNTTTTSLSFTAEVRFPADAQASSVAIGDIDGDGKPDLAVANRAADSVSVFLNKTTAGSLGATFDPKIDFAMTSQPSSVDLVDLDGNGLLDLISNVAGQRNTTTAIGDPTFSARVNYQTAGTPETMVVRDFNGDGKLDLVIANGNNGGPGASSTVSVLLNVSVVGSLELTPKLDFTVAQHAICVAAADLNGDGRLDLAVANFDSNSVSILRNTTN